MANENNCNPWETTPDYTIELNEQGPPGKKGDKGDDGYSPTITVYKNTEDEYVLNIINKNSNFLTPNLYGQKEWAEQDLENTPLFGRIRADVAGPTAETNISMPNIKSNMEGVSDYNLAINNLVIKNSNNDLTIYPYSPQTSNSANSLTLTIDGDEDSFNALDKPYLQIGNSLSQILFHGYEYVFEQQEHSLASTVKIECNTELTKSDTITATYGGKEIATVDDVTAVDNKLANKLEVTNIIAGDNITLDVDGNNVTINSTGGGGGLPDNYVTTDTVQTITASKTFSNSRGPAIALPNMSNLLLGTQPGNYMQLIQNGAQSEIRFSNGESTTTNLVVNNNTPENIYYNGKRLLNEGDINTTIQPKLTAGEGITIEDNVISSSVDTSELIKTSDLKYPLNYSIASNEFPLIWQDEEQFTYKAQVTEGNNSTSYPNEIIVSDKSIQTYKDSIIGIPYNIGQVLITPQIGNSIFVTFGCFIDNIPYPLICFKQSQGYGYSGYSSVNDIPKTFPIDSIINEGKLSFGLYSDGGQLVTWRTDKNNITDSRKENLNAMFRVSNNEVLGFFPYHNINDTPVFYTVPNETLKNILPYITHAFIHCKNKNQVMQKSYFQVYNLPETQSICTITGAKLQQLFDNELNPSNNLFNFTVSSTKTVNLLYNEDFSLDDNNYLSLSQSIKGSISTISQLQTTITELTNRIQALENNINGGNA